MPGASPRPLTTRSYERPATRADGETDSTVGATDGAAERWASPGPGQARARTRAARTRAPQRTDPDVNTRITLPLTATAADLVARSQASERARAAQLRQSVQLIAVTSRM